MGFCSSNHRILTVPRPSYNTDRYPPSSHKTQREQSLALAHVASDTHSPAPLTPSEPVATRRLFPTAQTSSFPI